MSSARILLLFAVIALFCGCICPSPPDKKTVTVAGDAMAQNDPSLCDTKLNETYQKDDCYMQVAVGLRNSEVCKKIERIVPDQCFYQVAMQGTAFGPCLEIQDNGIKSACIAAVAANKGSDIKEDITEGWDKVSNYLSGENNACWGIADADKKDACYKYSAINSNSTSMCGAIQDAGNRVECYSKIAIAKNDDNSCLRNSDNIEADKCLYTAAFATNDPGFCYNIINEFYRAKCYRIAGIAS